MIAIFGSIVLFFLILWSLKAKIYEYFFKNLYQYRRIEFIEEGQEYVKFIPLIGAELQLAYELWESLKKSKNSEI